jgi:hypothetical protein
MDPAAIDYDNDLVEMVDMSEVGAARNKKMTWADQVTALQPGIDARVTDFLVAGDNVTITPVDGTLEIAATPPGPGDISGFNEAVDDRVAALLQAGSGIGKSYDDSAGTLTLTATVSALNGAMEWAPNFTDAGDVYIPAVVAMTIDQGNAAIGAGTITFEKSTAAAPETFSAATLPVTLEAGAWLKVSSDDQAATHLVRTA